MSSITVRPLDVMTEARWSWNDQHPRWWHRQHGSSGTFDPFPAYPHRIEDVQAAAEHVQERFPPRWDVDLYVADREELGRSNGYSSLHEGGHYDGDQWVKDDPRGLIVLSGKRVPPHPAVTRYLVAHEYGHNVEWMLNADRDVKTLHDDGLVTEYAKLRGLGDTVHHGSGGRWHDAAPEILACDFRILVCHVEPAYWPHPGIPHPAEVRDVAAWWKAHTPG